jgi:hypothetical protein
VAVGEIIKRDPALSAKVLQLINSSFGIPRDVADVREAVTLLGGDRILAMALSMKLFTEITREWEIDVDYEGWRQRCLMVATWAEKIAKLTGHGSKMAGLALALEALGWHALDEATRVWAETPSTSSSSLVDGADHPSIPFSRPETPFYGAANRRFALGSGGDTHPELGHVILERLRNLDAAGYRAPDGYGARVGARVPLPGPPGG